MDSSGIRLLITLARRRFAYLPLMRMRHAHLSTWRSSGPMVCARGSPLGGPMTAHGLRVSRRNPLLSTVRLVINLPERRGTQRNGAGVRMWWSWLASSGENGKCTQQEAVQHGRDTTLAGAGQKRIRRSHMHNKYEALLHQKRRRRAWWWWRGARGGWVAAACKAACMLRTLSNGFLTSLPCWGGGGTTSPARTSPSAVVGGNDVPGSGVLPER